MQQTDSFVLSRSASMYTPGIASPGPIGQARSCEQERETGPLSHVGILVLQVGENINRRSDVNVLTARGT